MKEGDCVTYKCGWLNGLNSYKGEITKITGEYCDVKWHITPNGIERGISGKEYIPNLELIEPLSWVQKVS